MERESERRSDSRRSSAKSRLGCQTCKIRRIKCDETHPHCRRCTSTGRKCDGYFPLRTMTLALILDRTEVRSYQYFVENTAIELSGPYDQEFWKKTVLCVGMSDPGLRHAIVALGSLHEGLRRSEDSVLSPEQLDERRVFAFRQCNRAISALLHPLESGTSDVIMLLSCLLFMTFEILQDNCKIALEHLRIGAQILRKWETSHNLEALSKAEQSLIRDEISPIYARCLSSSEINPSRWPSTGQVVTVQPNNIPLHIPAIFHDLKHAQKSLHEVLEYVFAALRGLPENDGPGQLDIIVAQLQRHYTLWQLAFNQFQVTPPSDREARRSMTMLMLQFTMGKLMLATLPFDDDMVFDAYPHEFEQVVVLCKEFLTLEKTRSLSNATSSSFAFDICVIMPLYFVVTRCRDPCIRRRALDLLSSSHRREGIWHSGVAAMVAEQAIILEEKSSKTAPETCQDITAANRVRLIKMQYLPGKVAPIASSPPLLILTWMQAALASEEGFTWETMMPLPTPEIKARGDTGDKPYWVLLSHDLKFCHWKLLIGQKVFTDTA